MKITKKDFAIVVIVVLALAPIIWSLFMQFYVSSLFSTPDIESIAETIKKEDVLAIMPKEVQKPSKHAYGSYQGEFYNIPSIKSKINVMRDSKVPAFKYDDNTFIILHKGKGWSKGIVSSAVNANDPKLKDFTFKLLKNNLTLWTLDLNQ